MPSAASRWYMPDYYGVEYRHEGDTKWNPIPVAYSKDGAEARAKQRREHDEKVGYTGEKVRVVKLSKKRASEYLAKEAGLY